MKVYVLERRMRNTSDDYTAIAVYSNQSTCESICYEMNESYPIYEFVWEEFELEN
ncbi:MAG: hypothetical protein KBT03_13650 [Bacteroidales bacterium]|nr:hypothetical protein [Candidatus Scybalousia scybalohippi]